MQNIKNQVVIGGSRNSTIELLRILLIIGVIILHVCGPSIGNAVAITTGASSNILSFIRSMNVCAVDTFMILSGYYLFKSQSRDMKKMIHLFGICIMFSLGLAILGVVAYSHLSLSRFLMSFIVGHYFLLLYAAVYVLSPFVNVTLNTVSAKNFKLLMVLSMILFSIYPTAIEYLFRILPNEDNGMGFSFVSFFDRDGHGYTLVNFFLMFLIGAYLRNFGFPFRKRFHCLLTFILSSSLVFLKFYYLKVDEINYFSPAVIVQGVSLFNLFALTKETHANWINFISSKVFGVFIVHFVVAGYISRVMPLSNIVNMNLISCIMYVILFVGITFIGSLMVSIAIDYVYATTIGKMLKNRNLKFQIN